MKKLLATLFILAFTGMGYAQAQGAYPSKPITIIVPFAPGGTAEIVGRLIAQGMQKYIGETIIVDLKPGAGGNIGAEYVARSKPDGYTILLGSSSVASNPSLMKLNFDPAKELVGVFGIGIVPNVALVGTNSQFKNLKDLISFAKANPDKLTFGSSGLGTSSHLSGELFKNAAGIELRHIPYKGSGLVYPDLVSLRVDLLFDLQGSAVSNINGGLVRPLAVTSSKRSLALPDVPTIAELGYPGYENGSWFGLMVPAGTPKNIIDKIESAGLKALKDESVTQRLIQIGSQPIPSSQIDFNKYFLKDIAHWSKVLSDGKIEKLQ
jgi:tripartite-type tricarboxylate transporter receptor subunit TctC